MYVTTKPQVGLLFVHKTKQGKMQLTKVNSRSVYFKYTGERMSTSPEFSMRRAEFERTYCG